MPFFKRHEFKNMLQWIMPCLTATARACCGAVGVWTALWSETQVMLPAGDYRTCFEAKAEAVATATISGEYDFAFLHVKAVDDAGHDKAPALKVQPHIDTPDVNPLSRSLLPCCQAACFVMLVRLRCWAEDEVHLQDILS